MARQGIPVWRDITSAVLRKKAREEKDPRVAMRLFAMASLLEGMERGSVAQAFGITPQTLRDWVIRYNKYSLSGLLGNATGHPPRELTPEQENELQELVIRGPDNDSGRVRWRLVDLKEEIKKRYSVMYHERSVGKILHRLGFVRISVRPIHPHTDQQSQDDFKKNLQKNIEKILPEHAKNKPIEIWFQDEARVGQKGTLTRIWTKRGSRPRMKRDQRYNNAYIFGAVCPSRDAGAALVMPCVNTEAMNKHLQEISRTVNPGAYAIVILDGAAWHSAKGIIIPDNISLMSLPPYSPELNPQENIWQYIRQNYLAGRIFDTYESIVEASCSAWNALVREVGRIKSIATRTWAQCQVS
jgi:transposase